MDAVARALAEPNRRRILRLVRDGELTVGAIAEQFPISRPAISQHLRLLEDAQLVEVRPAGTRRYYRARPDGLAELRSWIDRFWTDRLTDLRREAEQHQLADAGDPPPRERSTP